MKSLSGVCTPDRRRGPQWSADAVSDLVAEGGTAAADATASLTFGGVYFSYKQAIWLDALTQLLKKSQNVGGG